MLKWLIMKRSLHMLAFANNDNFSDFISLQISDFVCYDKQLYHQENIYTWRWWTRDKCTNKLNFKKYKFQTSQASITTKILWIWYKTIQKSDSFLWPKYCDHLHILETILWLVCTTFYSMKLEIAEGELPNNQYFFSYTTNNHSQLWFHTNFMFFIEKC